MGGGGGLGEGGALLVDLVPRLEQKERRERVLFQAGQCAALSSFRVKKNGILEGKG